MSSSITTILVIGATSGIGEAFARRFHDRGKRVIATGRLQDRLASLAKELPGLEICVMDNADLASLPGHVKSLTTKYPDINTVWVNSGIQHAYSFKDQDSAISDEEMSREILVNTSAPTILARHFLRHLLNLGSEANLMMTSSGLAFTPFPFGPLYAATKAYIHSLCVSLRIQLKGTNVNVIEIVPPYVATELDANHRSPMMNPLPLKDYTDATFEVLDNRPAKTLREVGIGTAQQRAEAWRVAMEPVWRGYGLSEH
jgi:uncharacterized oxidoreductase